MIPFESIFRTYLIFKHFLPKKIFSIIKNINNNRLLVYIIQEIGTIFQEIDYKCKYFVSYNT